MKGEIERNVNPDSESSSSSPEKNQARRKKKKKLGSKSGIFSREEKQSPREVETMDVDSGSEYIPSEDSLGLYLY